MRGSNWFHSSWIYWSSCCKFVGCGIRFLMRSLRILQTFSIGLRSGDWAGHDKERIPCSCFQLLTDIALWARAPSSWNTGLRWSRFIRFQNDNKLSRSISIYFSWFTEPSMDIIGPNLSQQKHAHIIKHPPPNLIVGAIPTWIALSCVVLLILRSRDPYQSWIEHSSDHITRFQSFNVHPRWALLHNFRAFAFFLEMNGLRIAFLERRPRFLSFLPIVSLWTFKWRPWWISSSVAFLFRFTISVSLLASLSASFWGRPALWVELNFFESPQRLMAARTVDSGIFICREISTFFMLILYNVIIWQRSSGVKSRF